MKKSNFKRRYGLKKTNVVAIKEALWRGVSQEEIADRFMVSQAAISHIMKGRSHADVPWPDGSTGPAPHYRKDYHSSRSKFEHAEGQTGGLENMRNFGNINEALDDLERSISVAPPDEELEKRVLETLEAEARQEEEDLMATLQGTISDPRKEHVPAPTKVRAACVPWDRIQRSLGMTRLFIYIEHDLSEKDRFKARRIMGEIYANLPARLWHSLEVTKVVLDELIEAGIKVEM